MIKDYNYYNLDVKKHREISIFTSDDWWKIDFSTIVSRRLNSSKFYVITLIIRQYYYTSNKLARLITLSYIS